MPRIKPFTSYPTLFETAVRRVIAEGQQVEVTFDSSTRAAAWRGQFHAFIGSAYKRAKEPGALEEHKVFAQLASRVLCTMREREPGVWIVTLQDRDRGWQAEALATALGIAAVPTPEGLGLVPKVGPADGTSAVQETARSEHRAIEADPAAALGKSKKSEYY